MTETTLESTAGLAPDLTPGRMRRRQLAAMLGLEVRRILLRGRGAGLVLVALLPVGLFVLRAAFKMWTGQEVSAASSTTDFADMYRQMLLAVIVFFTCAAVFGNTVRREILERTLHFYFLMPLRREVLLAGKYLGAVVALGLVFSVSVVGTFVAAYVPAGVPAMTGFLLHGPGLGHLAAYLGVLLLAVAGYGAVFLTLGLFFRRPAFPIVFLFFWEAINFLLPPLLKRLSVAFYLNSLTPVPVADSPFAVLADAPSPWAAVLGLLALSAALLAVAAWKIKRTEILYGED